MKKTIKILYAAVVCAVCLTVISTTVFASGKKLYGLSKEEVFDTLWERITTSHDGLDGSLMYDDCKKFVSEKNIDKMDYDTSAAYKEFKSWYDQRHTGREIQPYSEKVIAYLKDHPDADLRYSDQGVYDLNIRIDTADNLNESYKNSVYMQYDKSNMSKVYVWTYDSTNEQFVCKDESGNTVQTVYAYTKPPYIPSEVSEISTTEEPSRGKESSETAIEDDPITQISEEAPVEEQASETTIEASNKSSDDSSKDNSTLTTIIVGASGIIIAAVFAFLIVRQKKRRV